MFVDGQVLTAAALNSAFSAVTTAPVGDVLTAGTDFTPGTSTSVTLSRAYGSINNIKVHFDTAYQGINQLASLVGNTLTFTAPIPVGVVNVFVDGATAQVIGVPSPGSVGVPMLAADTLTLIGATGVDLALPDGSSDVGFIAAGVNAAPRDVQSKLRELGNVDDYFQIGDANYTNAFDRVVLAATASPGGATTRLLRKAYVVSATIPITQAGIVFEGVTGDRWDGVTHYGSQIQYTGTGPLFQLGTDNGHAWNANDYDGPGGLTLRNVAIKHTNPDTLLGCNPTGGTDKYKAGGYAIQDWRGGGNVLENVQIENFEYNFWGIQSDINVFRKVTSLYSRWGIYAGPRSDQFSIEDLYSFACDNALVVDGCDQLRLVRPQIVGCGNATLHAILIRQGSGPVVIEAPWFEHYQYYDGVDQIAFVGCGTEAGYGGATTPVKAVVINEPYHVTDPTGQPFHTKYMCEMGKANRVVINNPASGRGQNFNLDALIGFKSGVNYTDNTDTNALVRGRIEDVSQIYVNNGTGTPEIAYELWGFGATRIGTANGRLLLARHGAGAGAGLLQMGTEGVDGQIVMSQPFYASGQTSRFVLRKAYVQNNAMPTAGTYEVGDYVHNIAPAINTWAGGFAGLAGAKYVVRGWNRITTGSAHVLNTDWVEDRSLTGV